MPEEKLTLDEGVLKLNAVIVGIAPYVIVALLLVVSTAFTVVERTVGGSEPEVVASTVCEIPLACTG